MTGKLNSFNTYLTFSLFFFLILKKLFKNIFNKKHMLVLDVFVKKRNWRFNNYLIIILI